MEELYKNGTYWTTIDTGNGTKYFTGDMSGPEFPDSIDLKITDYCPYGCSFCYENSGRTGREASLETIKEIFEDLPKVPIEVAVGGGAATSHSRFREIIIYLFERGHIVNLTVNPQELLEIYKPDLRLISGLGISVGSGIGLEKLSYPDGPKQIVWHTIAGITPVETILDLLWSNERVLVLGYKNMGRAKTTRIPRMQDLEIALKTWIHRNSLGTLAFDELAVQQLGIRGTLLEADWNKIWLGPEFSHTMFVDAVAGKFYPSSTERESGVSAKTISITNYFKTKHVRDKNY